MRLEATRTQLLGLAIASVLVSTAVWLRTVLVGHDWITFVLAEVLVLALLWGLGRFVLTRYADEWGPYFVWTWRRKDGLDKDRRLPPEAIRAVAVAPSTRDRRRRPQP